MNKMVITCAVTGAETTREQNPGLPVTSEEIADAANEACAAGASILHLHVRDREGNPTQDVEVFQKTIELVRKNCDMVIEATTGGAVGMSFEERMQPLELLPEMASLDCGTVNFGESYILNTLPMIREGAKAMRDWGIRPTLECFDLSHIEASKVLIQEGLIEYPHHYGLVFNSPGGVCYDPETFNLFIKHLPAGAFWTAIGIGGRASMQVMFHALAAGGFIRVGFEDNIYYEKGILAKSNAQLVDRAVRLSKESGLEIATPSDVRAMFKLKN